MHKMRMMMDVREIINTLVKSLKKNSSFINVKG